MSACVVFLFGEEIENLPPNKRPVNTVFQQDLATLENRLDSMRPLTDMAGATDQLEAIGESARGIVASLSMPGLTQEQSGAVVARFGPLRDDVSRLTRILSAHVDLELKALQQSTREAQEISAWQVAALLPGTLVLVLFFTLLIARPIRQIDQAIRELGKSGFSHPIEIKGPTCSTGRSATSTSRSAKLRTSFVRMASSSNSSSRTS